jgi:uncharacterized protein (TIGR02145 family)
LVFKRSYRLNSGAVNYSSSYDDYNGIFWCPDSITAPYDGIPAQAGVLTDTIGSLAACETYGALYSPTTTFIRNGRSTGVLTGTSTDLEQPPLFYDSVNVVQGICPPGWFLPTEIHWGKMINLVETNYLKNLPVRLDTLYGCDTLYGNNAIKTDYYPRLSATDSSFYFNPCQHIDWFGFNLWRASVAAYKELLSTNIAPYRPLDTVANYVGGTLLHYGLTTNRRLLTAPKRIKRYATQTNPVWSYFTPETAGTDKYGFSILPAGIRYWNQNNTYLMGEAAGFSIGSVKSALQNTATAIYNHRLFLFNMQLNAVMPHAIFSSAYTHQDFGTSVRCIARKVN